MDLSGLDVNQKKELMEILKMKEEYIKYNQIELFTPYKFQLDFYNASRDHQRRFLCAANR